MFRNPETPYGDSDKYIMVNNFAKFTAWNPKETNGNRILVSRVKEREIDQRGTTPENQIESQGNYPFQARPHVKPTLMAECSLTGFSKAIPAAANLGNWQRLISHVEHI
jgi:hypothetical protein